MTGAHQWRRCTDSLQVELPEQQFNTWIRPLQAEFVEDEMCLFAPNKFVLDWVKQKFLPRIEEIIGQDAEASNMQVRLDLLSSRTSPPQAVQTHHQFVEKVESKDPVDPPADTALVGGVDLQGLNHQQPSLQHEAVTGSAAAFEVNESPIPQHTSPVERSSTLFPTPLRPGSRPFGGRSGTSGTIEPARTQSPEIRGARLNRTFTFDSFVEGKSNQLALAATKQVATNPGTGYNPLFLYGGVGLGKTHLMQAVGNALTAEKPNAKVVYLHSERFVQDMVKALQLNAINDFKRYYRSVDALLIDDIQFFANKDRSQEEFFHTFNSLFEGEQQMIFTCDRYPKEIDGLEERLKSRFGWGLTVSVEPPELETRAAILMKKAAKANVELDPDAAFFIAERIRSNVRELEGALKRVIASAQFSGRPITIDLIREALKDLLALQERLVTVDNIQRVVAEYYKIKLNDLLSKKRTRSLARPRQLAMALSKELTNHSLPEIGDAFGGRDHTTVLHACRKIKELRETSADIREDLKNLNRILST